MQYLLPSLRLWLVTFAICVVGYTALVLAFAQSVAPFQANGSIIEADGRAVGSKLIAQDFSSPRYFWPRPSAVDYDGMGAGGSNTSPTSPELTDRAKELIARYGATADIPIPADLVAASGGGLDPHVSLEGALFQADRVAAARGLAPAEVRRLIEAQAVSAAGPFAPERIVNVLELNLALDRQAQ
ncbi:potassium-transporting ATPase subunit KdpC [Erythrobacter sp. T5W1-R]|uniref:potassium-transporting ATPase subunit KdpC n=1 Tax=Erythrobacter sp. T5W1-R TaxID=3101752 RepID=UPI002AFDDBFE|nr:potassium-transporting ATPase subunit KdpC [Erythrobacter sp. T5W1-R]MEA1618593.1 potassium-transporting ATPase subunit KdpC [Erythrobacter sp. T5W1-R]